MCLGGMARMVSVWIAYGKRMAEGRAVVLPFRQRLSGRRTTSGVPRAFARLREPPRGI